MKSTKIFLFILLSFFFISINSVRATDVSGGVTVTVETVDCVGSLSSCSGGSHTFKEATGVAPTATCSVSPNPATYSLTNNIVNMLINSSSDATWCTVKVDDHVYWSNYDTSGTLSLNSSGIGTSVGSHQGKVSCSTEPSNGPGSAHEHGINSPWYTCDYTVNNAVDLCPLVPGIQTTLPCPTTDSISVSLSATPVGPLTAPGTTKLTWTTTGSPTSCDASGVEWSGSNLTSGVGVAQRSGMPAHTYKFGITCHKVGATDATDTVTVVVNTPVTTPISVSISATPSSTVLNKLIAPGATDISWTMTGNPTSCDATSSSWSGTDIKNGDPVTHRSGMTAGTYTFGITCHKAGIMDAVDTVIAYVANPIITPTGTWSYPSACPTACGIAASNQTQTCTGGNSLCSGTAATRTCAATAICPPGGITDSISATPSSTVLNKLIAPGATDISWTMTGNPTSCDATSSSWSGTDIKNGDPVTQRSGMSAGNYAFGITCHKAGIMDAIDTVVVYVKNPTPTGTWSYPSACPTACGIAASNQTQTCTGGNSLCSGTAATRTCSATAVCPLNAPTASISVSPSSVTSGDRATISWSSTNATSCTASGPWSNSGTLSGSGLTDPLTGTTTYTLTCTGNGQTSTDSATVTVTGITPTGTWSYPSACPTAPGSSSSTQTQVCTGGNSLCSGTAATRTCPAISLNAPTASISVSPSSVTSGDRATISWSSTNATSCTASGPWSNQGSLSGSGLTDPLTGDTTFTLTCTGNGQTVTDSATVTVTAIGNKTDGVWSVWSPDRLQGCGDTGTQTRTCVYPNPSNKGAYCPSDADGLALTKDYVNTDCPVITPPVVTVVIPPKPVDPSIPVDPLNPLNPPSSSGSKIVPDGDKIPYNGKITMTWEEQYIASCTCTYKDSTGKTVDCPNFNGTPYSPPALKKATLFTLSCLGKVWGSVTVTKEVLVNDINTNYKEN